MFSIYQTIFYKKFPRISKEEKLYILPVARWFGEELFTYIRVFGSITSPHVLPYYVPNKLLGREIVYETAGDDITKTLKEQKKSIWPTFPLQCVAFALHDLGHATK